MTQADSVHSTPPTNTSDNNVDPSRQGFLAQAAGVAAGSASDRGLRHSRPGYREPRRSRPDPGGH